MNRGRGGYRGGGRHNGARGRSAGRYVVRQNPVGTHPDDALRKNPEMTSINGGTMKFNDMSTSDHSYRPNPEPSRSVENSEQIHQGYRNDLPSLSTHSELNASTVSEPLCGSINPKTQRSSVVSAYTMNHGRGGYSGGRHNSARGRSAGSYVVRQNTVGTHPDDDLRKNPEMTSINGRMMKFNDMSTSDHSYRPNPEPSRSVENSEQIHQGYRNDLPSLSTHSELHEGTVSEPLCGSINPKTQRSSVVSAYTMNHGRGGYRGGRHNSARGRSAGSYVVRQNTVGTHPDDALRKNPEMTSINGVTMKFNDMSTSDHSYRPNPELSRSVENSEQIHQGYRNDLPSLSTKAIVMIYPELNASTTQMIQSRYVDEENLTLSCISLTPDDNATHRKKEPSERTSEFEISEQHKGLSFDICEERNRNVVKLKTSLLDKNRAMRNEAKRRTQGNNIEILRTGMILLKGYVLLPDQVRLIKVCRDLGRGSGGFYQPGFRDGATLHLKMMCLGKNWDPETSKYDDKRPIDGAKPPPIPEELLQLVKGAIQECHGHLQSQYQGKNWRSILPSMSPNICIINFYTKTGKLGLHQDKDESQESLRKGLPVVSFSLGDSAEFLFGDQRDIDKAEKVVLESGDVLIFGGESRRIFHGVSAIHPDTAPKALLDETNLRPGRLNLTFREY